MLNVIINGQGPEPPNTMYTSGGTTRLIEIMKRMCRKNVNLYVISSESVCNTFQKNGIKANYQLVSSLIKNTTNYTKLLIDSIFRTVLVCFFGLPTSKGILYSPSDFLWDVFPAFIWKLRNKNVKWIQIIHHLYSNPFKRVANSLIANFLGYFSQKVSFFFIKRQADLIIVVNPIVKRELRKSGFNSSTIEVIPNGVDIAYLRSINRSSETSYDAVNIARLNRSKGIFDLVKIWSLVTKEKPNARLAIIGSGDNNLKRELITEIERCNLNKNIDVLGYLDTNKAFEIVKASKIFIFPSHEEGFGIAICEAMACGLPVVAWNLSIYENIYKKNILEVPIGDINQFAKTVIKLLNNAELRNDFGLKGQKFVQKYDWDKSAEREERIIKSIND